LKKRILTKLRMKKIEELCIKYLMNETDPSETAHIRAEIIDDSDALIEYESLKSTLNRLDALPHISPPEHVTSVILEKARKNKRITSKLHGIKSNKWMIAAGLSFVAISGVIATVSIMDGSFLKSNTLSSSDNHWVDKNDIITVSPGNQTSVPVSEHSNKLKPVVSTPQETVENTDIKLAGSKQVVIKP